MKRQGGPLIPNTRPMSIDEMNTSANNGIMLQSTNESRIHEILPNVSKQQKQNMFNQTRVRGFGVNSNKVTANQQQMRQTMFNNGNYMNKIRTSNIDQNSKGKFNTFNQYENNDTRDGSLNQPHTSQNARKNTSTESNKIFGASGNN